MSKATFYRIPVKRPKVHEPRRGRDSATAEPHATLNFAPSKPRRQPLRLRRIALAKMPELK